MPRLGASFLYLPDLPLFHGVDSRLFESPAEVLINAANHTKRILDQIDVVHAHPAGLHLGMGQPEN